MEAVHAESLSMALQSMQFSVFKVFWRCILHLETIKILNSQCKSIFKYKYKFFWRKVFKIQVKILFMYLKWYFKYLHFKYSPTLITFYILHITSSKQFHKKPIDCKIKWIKVRFIKRACMFCCRWTHATWPSVSRRHYSMHVPGGERRHHRGKDDQGAQDDVEPAWRKEYWVRKTCRSSAPHTSVWQRWLSMQKTCLRSEQNVYLTCYAEWKSCSYSLFIWCLKHSCFKDLLLINCKI